MKRMCALVVGLAVIAGSGAPVVVRAVTRPVALSIASIDAPTRPRRAVSNTAVAALSKLVGARYLKARESFLFNEDFLQHDISHNPFSIAVDRWNRRLDACGDNACRYAELSAQLARLNFSLGKAPAPIPGMLLRTGAFQINESRVGGDLAIMPVGDGSVVMAVTTAFANPDGSGAWDCAGYVATGILSSRGPSHMTLYDDRGPILFDLRILSPTSVGLSENAANEERAAKDPSWPRLCPTGTIFGTYRGQPIRSEGAKRRQLRGSID